MKPYFIIPAGIFLLFAASCKKEDCQPENFWQVGDLAYQVQKTTPIVPGPTVQLLYVEDGTEGRTSGINFYFETLPTESGVYEVSAQASGKHQMQILATSYLGNDAYGIYSSTGNDRIMANVTVNAGKISIDMPAVWAKNRNGDDSVKVMARVSQQ